MKTIRMIGAAVALVCVWQAQAVLAATDCVTVPPGLVGWWRADGNPMDAAGTNDGLLAAGVLYAPGKTGAGFLFNGGTSRVILPDAPAMRFTSSFTIETWIHPTAYPKAGALAQILFRGDTRYCLDPYYLSLDSSGKIRFHVAGTGCGVDLIAGEATLNGWTHVAAMLDGQSGQMLVYTNGILAGAMITLERPFATLEPSASPGIVIGNIVNGVHGFSGVIDELSVYDRALSGDEVRAVFLAGVAGKCAEPRILRSPQSQVGFWGATASFDVVVAGTEPLAYQWLKNGTNLVGQTAASLVLTNLELSDAGTYSVTITNIVGSAVSAPAVLTVNPAGVDVALYAGITIEGIVGRTYGIQWNPDLADTNGWRGITNLTLVQPIQLWYDSEPALNPRRFYRVVPGPIGIP